MYTSRLLPAAPFPTPQHVTFQEKVLPSHAHLSVIIILSVYSAQQPPGRGILWMLPHL
jgi:hypothetical protein